MKGVSRYLLGGFLLGMLALASCGGSDVPFSSSAASSPSASASSEGGASSSESSLSSEGDPANAIGLEQGDGTYDIDETISNAGGSFSYELFVRSFYDANGDGTGDFAGVSAKADYLKSLGVGQVWLMPIFPSPTYHGYDVSNYYDVNSAFGSLSDFTSMVSTLHAKGIKVYLDMILNHSSIKNPWFESSYSDRLFGDTSSTSKADWYNWASASKSGYTPYGTTGAYYEARFDASMPDFNFDSAGVQAEFKKILTFWCAKGVDGFRLDAVKYYYYGDMVKNIAALNTLVADVKSDYPATEFVGENWSSGDEYYGYYESQINSFFCFDESITSTGDATLIGASKGFVDAKKFTDTIAGIETKIKTANPESYSSYFLSNHDQDRISKSLGGVGPAKVGSSLTYLLPGTPYCYYGEEEQLKGIRGSGDQSDVLRRLPMIWSSTSQTGQCAFPDPSKSNLAGSFTQITKGVEDLLQEPLSILNHYRKVASIRNKYPLFKKAAFTSLNSGDSHVIAYKLADANSAIVVVINNRNIALEVDVSSFAGNLLDEIDSSNLKARLQNGRLGLGAFSCAILSSL